VKKFQAYVGQSASDQEDLELQPFVGVLIELDDDEFVSLDEFDVAGLEEALRQESDADRRSVLESLRDDLLSFESKWG